MEKRTKPQGIYSEKVDQNLGYGRGKGDEKGTRLDLINHPEISPGKELLLSLQDLCSRKQRDEGLGEHERVEEDKKIILKQLRR